jgi:hypothetical protein
MLALVNLTPNALTDPASLAALESMAAEHEIVLSYTDTSGAGRLLPQLRGALPHRQLVALLVNGPPVTHERQLVEDLLDEGRIPLVIAVGDEVDTAPGDWSWLAADCVVALPAQTSH